MHRLSTIVIFIRHVQTLTNILIFSLKFFPRLLLNYPLKNGFEGGGIFLNKPTLKCHLINRANKFQSKY